MLPILVGAATSMGGSALDFFAQREANSANTAMARETNSFNAAEAQKNRDYQTTMSNSAYQRSMDDMQKAGLNPMLAAQQGGASTPGGATASGVQARVDPASMGRGLTNMAASALELSSMAEDVRNKRLAGVGQQLSNEEQEAALPAIKEHGKYDSQYAGADAVARRATGGSLVDKAIKGGVYGGALVKKIIDSFRSSAKSDMSRYQFKFNKPDYSRSTGKGDFYPDKYPQSKKQNWGSGIPNKY